MAIGSFESLSNAAQGRMAPRVITPPAPVLEPYSGGLTGGQQANALAQAKLSSGAGLVDFNRGTGGLSSKGKYSGYFSAGDQQLAIEGSARNLKESSGTYREKAQAYMNKLDSMYGEASKGPSRAFISQGTAQMPGVDPRRPVTPGGYVDKIVNPSRKYANQLNDWYTEQSTPALKYNAAAEQIDRTPISQYAEQIATSSYGMNPDLARGKFVGLDEIYYKEQQNLKFLRDNGIPYEQYMSGLQEGNKLYTADTNAAQMGIESLTGFKSSAIESLTGRNPVALYNDVLKKSDIEYTDQDTTYSTDGETLTKLVLEKIANGETDNVFKLGESMKAKDPAVASFIYSLLYLAGYKDTKITNDLYLGGLISQ